MFGFANETRLLKEVLTVIPIVVKYPSDYPF